MTQRYIPAVLLAAFVLSGCAVLSGNIDRSVFNKTTTIKVDGTEYEVRSREELDGGTSYFVKVGRGYFPCVGAGSATDCELTARREAQRQSGGDD